MKEFVYTITDPEGIHARPAGLLVQKAKTFVSSITLKKDGKSADAKKIFAAMGLAAKQGETLTILVEGADEDTAAAELENFFKSNL
jgi:phosphocarrier protein